MHREFYELYLRCFPEYPVAEEVFCQVLRPEAAHLITETGEGRMAGYAMIHGESIPVLCVAEEYRRQGIGSRLLRAAEEYIRNQGGGRVCLGQGPHYLLQGVPEGPAVDFFQRRSYTASWSSINMELALDGFDAGHLDIPPAPAGLECRFAREEDLPALLKAVEAAEEGWVDIFASCEDPIFLAVLDGEIAGFEILTPDGGYFLRPGQQVGSVGCVGVVPSMRERGIGMDMAAQGIQWLKDQGSTLVELRYTWLEDWYGKLGFHTVSRQWMGERELA